MYEIAVVFTGGDAPGQDSVADLPGDRFVVAADAGLAHARDLGIAVDVAVGDFDSVSDEVLSDAAARGVQVLRHPRAKDQTDLELALDLAVGSGAPRILVVGGQGGRLDHSLGNVASLVTPRLVTRHVEARSGRSRIFVARTETTFTGVPGEYVSLLAWQGPARGVRTEGLRWSLAGEQLEPGSSLGLSNELIGTEGRVALDAGVLLVVLPGELAHPV